MREDWIECTFEDLLDYEQPTKYIVKEEDYNDKYPTPVLTAGKGFIKGYTKENFGIFDNLPTIIFDDFTTASQFVNFRFKVKSSAMKILLPKSNLVNLKFVFGAMQVNKVRSETHKRYWISEFSKIYFGLPPLSEQCAIVKKMEQLFSALDASIADLKKAQGQLKIYRQAVLKKAFQDNFSKIKLGDIAQVKRGKSKHRPRNDKRLFGGAYPFIQTGEIRKANGGVITKYETTYSEFGLAQSKLWPKGTLCLTIAANIGETAYLGFDACFPDSVVGIKTNEEILDLKYFNYFIQLTKSEIDRKASATAQKNINVEFLESLPIPVPETIKEQHKIVKEIESRLSVCDAVEQQIKTSLDKAEALRQSILKKAFAGALLTQAELEACRKEPDYEPASVLLEKIKAEKQTGKKNTEKEKAIIPAKPAVAVTAKISTDIQAGLIAKVIRLHEGNPQHHTLLTHIKCEKLSHLVEYHLQIPLGRQPVKDAAGPDDYPRLKKVEHRAKMAGYFSIQKNKIGHTYVSGKGIGKAITQFEKNLSEGQKQRVDQLLHLFLTFDLEQAEIVATVYAAWNNLLILGKNKPTDQEIVQEARYNWSDRKLGLEEHRFYKAIEWMQKDTVNLVPTGYGTLVDFPKKKK
ncbi:restriction endonuclease subunit S [Chryseobacterium taeanense]|uniref:restriction endonuclease subunit S n=1 Tax=Chryseobacterium taeanense TaxID=311334 RepID=UPI0035B277BF